MVIRITKKNPLDYINRRNVLFWLFYVFLISGIIFSTPNGYFTCEREIEENYCREPLGGFFVFPWFGPFAVAVTWFLARPVLLMFYHISMILDLGWEFPLVSQPYNERIPTLPLIGWLILLLGFYIYARIIFQIMKLIYRSISNLIRKK